MDNCENREEQHFLRSCNPVPYAITQKHLESLFREHECCMTTVVYLDKRNDGQMKQTLNVVENDEYTLFFTQKGDYYYVYVNMFQQLLVWSKHPRSFGVEGRLGNHISIGFDSKHCLDVHETIYGTRKANVGQNILIFRKTYVYYHVDSDGYLIPNKKTNLKNLQAPVLWNDIHCFLRNQETLKKGGAPSVANRKILKKNGRNRPIHTVANVLMIAKQRIDQYLPHASKSHTGVIRIPFCVDEVRLAQELNHAYPDLDFAIWLNSHHHVGFILI